MFCGIYKITWKGYPEAKPYFGSTIRPFKIREREHLKRLSSGKHSNKCLSNYWKKYGKKSFSFELFKKFEIGSISLEDLRKLEQEILNSYSENFYHKLANGRQTVEGRDDRQTEHLRNKYGKRIEIDGVIYPSITNAINLLGMPDSKIRYRLNSCSPRWKSYKFLGEAKQDMHKGNIKNSLRLKVDGVEYSSLFEASRHLGVSNFTIRRRLEDEKWSNYARVLTD